MRTNWQRRRSGGNPFEALESRTLLAATPQLLADINTQQSGNPRDFIEFDGRLFYTVNHAQFGRELWSSDGTPEGTQLVKDIYPGGSSSSVSDLFVFHERLYFTAYDGAHGEELWSSDGTADGTQLLKDINVGFSGSSISNFVISGDWLYFTASDSAHGTELWRTDGTAVGTELFREMRPGASSGMSSIMHMVDVAGTLFFTAYGDSFSNANLWSSDGTQAGTSIILPLRYYSDVDELTAIGNRLFFSASVDPFGEELWTSDGTVAGTKLVKDINPGSSSSWPSDFKVFGDELIFEVSSQIWRSDGTEAGTRVVQGELPFSYPASRSPTVAGDTLFFFARDSSFTEVLWALDASAELARKISTSSALGYSPSMLAVIGDSIYFQSNGSRLWRSDGTDDGTQLLTTLQHNGASLSIDEMIVFQDELFFTTANTQTGADLWRTDGTSAGTSRWQTTIAPYGASSSVKLAVAGNRLFFAGSGQGSGIELWGTDGVAAPALLADVTGVGTDSSFASQFVATTTHVFFRADNGQSAPLYAVPAAGGAAVQIAAGNPYYALIKEFKAVGNLLYYIGTDENGRDYLGVSDGTLAGSHRLNVSAGTAQPLMFGLAEFEGGVIFVLRYPGQQVQVARANTDAIQVVTSLTTTIASDRFESILWQGQYYFVAGNGADLWRTDGTAAGTQRLNDVVPNLGAFGHSLTATDSALYFVSQPIGPTAAALWRTDGTAAGSYPYALMATPERLIAAGNYLFYTLPTGGSSGTGGGILYTLWATDGTIPGTRSLWNYAEIGANYSSNAMPPEARAASLDGYLYYFAPAQQGPAQFALWRSDGTPAGTTRVRDLPRSTSLPWAITALDGRLFLSVDGVLYMSDGTEAGTRELVHGYSVGREADSFRSSITSIGDTLYFSYQIDGYGSEPSSYTHEYSSVVGRELFYNRSKYDGNSASLNSGDDAAVATDKTAYLAGSGLATFANISSYSRGINGLRVLLANMQFSPTPLTLTINDFKFRMGTSSDPTTWVAAPAPNGFLVQEMPIAGGLGKRVSFSWSDNVIQNTWLEVTVLANERTGLAQPDVFYFGNRIGDTGSGTATAATTTAADELLVRNNTAPNQSISSLLDFNRDGAVTATDALIARGNIGVLRKLDLPAPGVPALVVPAQSIAAPLAVAIEQVEKHSGDENGNVLRVAEPAAKELSRGQLLACAMQSWNDWLDVDDEELVAGLQLARRR